MKWLSGVVALFGIWVIVSPWVFSYSGNTGGSVSAVIVGGVVLLLAGIRFFSGFASDRQAPAKAGMSMRDMVSALVRAPEEQREIMVGERLMQFASQAEPERSAGMQMMLTAALQLPRDDYKKLAASRLKVMMSLPAGDQMKLMKTHVSVLTQLPQSQQRTEMEVMKELLMGMPGQQRQMMAEMMGQAGMQMAI